MNNQLIELTRTSDSIYYCCLLPKDAHKIFAGVTNTYGSKSIQYLSNQKGGLNSEELFLGLKPESHFELLGTLDTLTEDQAREIVDSLEDQEFVEATWWNVTCKQDLIELIESKGINTKDNVIPIIKVKL
jgi:hypothetical protein